MGSLKKKWLAVMDECAKVAKDGYNSYQRYKYASAAGVMEAINPALVRNGIATTAEAELLELREVTLVQETRTKTERLATVKVTVTLHDVDTDETMKISGIGGGQDAGDKAVMKAQTAAMKYAFMMALEMSTGDDPEKDNGTDAYYSSQGYGYSTDAPPQQPPQQKASTQQQPNAATTCSACGKGISDKVATYSKQKFGEQLCYDCQQKRKGDGGKTPF